MRIHHLGIVVPALEPALEQYQRVLGFELEGGPVFDAAQDCHLAMLVDAGGARIELIAPASGESPVAAQAKKGGGLAHVCYEVDSLDQEISRLRRERAIVVRPPVGAVLFGGRRVAFLFMKGNMLVELVEKS
jgi:methylmalonyl-CoA/ethylmalonyl-CoA epimerase